MGLVLAFKKSTAEPQFSEDPSYSGSLIEGQTLTGSHNVTGAKTVDVEWWSYATIDRVDPILRASVAEYTILAADVGRYLEYKVVATNAAGEVERTSGLTPQVLEDTAPVPEFTVGATVAGQPRVGATLVANWTVVNATSVTVQWQSSADDITYGNITDATNASFVPTASEEGDYIRVVVTATNGGGSIVSTSQPTGQIAAAEAELPPPAGAPVDAIPLNAANVASRTLSDGAVLLKNTGAYYYCVGDMTFSGPAFVVNANNITLDLNGCTVTYNTSGEDSVWGGPLPTSYDEFTFTADRRGADKCKVNRNGIYSPRDPDDTVYNGDTTPGGQTVTNSYNQTTVFTLKNGVLKSDAGGHLSHAISATSGGGVWTVSNMRVESGTGIHSRCVIGQYLSLRAYDSVFICKSRSWFHYKDRHALPATIQCPSANIKVERCAVIGGISGIGLGSSSWVKQTFVSNYCFLTNGWAVVQFNQSNVLVEDCVCLPYNGRGIYFDLSSARTSTARNNVVLTWEYRNQEYGDNLTASAFKTRYDSQGHLFTGNHCLSVAGRRVSDAATPTWQGTYPITVVAPAKRASATAMWGEAYAKTASLQSVGYDNIFRGIYYGIRENGKQYASAMTISGGDAASGGGKDDYYGNQCFSNYGMVCTNQVDGIGRSKAAHANNTFTWETGAEAYTAFTAAADAKLATLGLTAMVLGVANEQKAVVYALLDDAINQEDAGLLADRAFWMGEWWASSTTQEFVTVTDPILGSGVDTKTRKVLSTNLSNPAALRTAKTHAMQILNGGSPVANATVTVTPNEVSTPFSDVTTTTTDENGSCVITYYEHAYARQGGASVALASQTGTSSTVAVDGVGAKSVTHASLGSTLDLGV